jgi:hypothetical protein
MHALVAIGVALVAQAAPEARAKEIVGRMTFPDAESVKAWTDRGPEYKSLADILLRRENWILAVRELEERLGPFGDAWTIEVALDEWDGSLAAKTERGGDKGRIRFNMRRLGEYERKMMALRKQADDLKREGKRMAWKVPPVKYVRLLHHELTHVLQGVHQAPGWFHEGLATWAGADMNYVIAYAHARKPVLSIEVDLSAGPDDEYGRGMMFFRWLESVRGAAGVRKLYRATVVDGREWKPALEEVSGLAWADLVEAERAWSVKFCAEHRPD